VDTPTDGSERQASSQPREKGALCCFRRQSGDTPPSLRGLRTERQMVSGNRALILQFDGAELME
jgi:hypothetical protein